MSYIASLALLFGCIKLVPSGGVKLATGVFTIGKVAIALLLGSGLGVALFVALFVGVVSFGYFWLLDRFEGSGLWWVVLIAGLFLLF